MRAIGRFLPMKGLGVGTILVLTACVATSYHKAYEEAWVVGSEPKKGVILHLHGCNGKGRYTSPWFAHLQSQGFLVISPNSFADPRPDASCAPPWPGKKQIANIRRRQTDYSIREVRKSYPDVPLFIWGHSEGGWLAYSLKGHFAGVLVTGHACGYGADAAIRVSEDVPLLVIQGTNDPYVSMSNARRTCVQLNRSLLWRLVLIQGTGHLPSFFLDDIRQPVEEFFNQYSK